MTREMLPSPSLPPAVWHYTPWFAMHGIIKSGMVRGVSEYREKDWNVPLVWFSKNQQMELTAGAGERKHYFRIGFPPEHPDLIWWPKLASCGRAKPGVRFHLEKNGRRKGANPADWCGVIAEGVALDNLPIEFQVGKEWKPIDLESAASALAVAQRSISVKPLGNGKLQVSVGEGGE